MPPIVVRRSGDFSLVFTDKDGNRTTLSEENALPVVLDELLREFRLMADIGERILDQFSLITKVYLSVGERLQD